MGIIYFLFDWRVHLVLVKNERIYCYHSQLLAVSLEPIFRKKITLTKKKTKCFSKVFYDSRRRRWVLRERAKRIGFSVRYRNEIQKIQSQKLTRNENTKSSLTKMQLHAYAVNRALALRRRRPLKGSATTRPPPPHRPPPPPSSADGSRGSWREWCSASS